MYSLQLHHLTKTIKEETVLQDICAEMESGHIYGIVGENGSGKSMLFRAMAGLIRLDRGDILVNGQPVKESLPQVLRMGLVLENVGLQPELNAMDNLQYLAKICGCIGKTEIQAALQRVGLSPDNQRRIQTYSLGMRQKLILAQAIMERPEILLLDEPTNALDEESVKRIHRILLEEKERGALIVLTSHNREDIEELCDTVYHMQAGVLKTNDGEMQYEI